VSIDVAALQELPEEEPIGLKLDGCCGAWSFITCPGCTFLKSD
jgi:hypothetical protein